MQRVRSGCESGIIWDCCEQVGVDLVGQRTCLNVCTLQSIYIFVLRPDTSTMVARDLSLTWKLLCDYYIFSLGCGQTQRHEYQCYEERIWWPWQRSMDAKTLFVQKLIYWGRTAEILRKFCFFWDPGNVHLTSVRTEENQIHVANLFCSN